jgi:hypothetical protein
VLNELDHDGLLLDVMVIADEVDSRFMQSVRNFVKDMSEDAARGCQNGRWSYIAFFFSRLTLAHLAREAATIFARDFADTLRRLRVGLIFPLYAATNAESAASNPDNSRSTRSRSCFSCLTMVVMSTI